MTPSTPLKLSGQRSKCATCGLHFTSTSSFDDHRTGKIGTSSRRCLSTDELSAKGFEPNALGFWRVPFAVGEVFA